ncbi:MAG: hypothetical protein E7170_01930 [Firmicutes bacterium]|nr:hypothetical protein [Bacillota bacterium]
MIQLNDILKKYDIKPYRYINNGNITIVEDKNERFVVRKKSMNEDIYSYLKTRNFDYFPRIVNDLNEDFIIQEYIEDEKYPSEQKILDLINLVSLLHNKTTHYKEVDIEDYKRLYEDISNNIEYLKSYYFDIITTIETHTFMSPHEYLFARNISKINSVLNFCEIEVSNWYKLVKDKTKERQVVLHNNLDLSHFIKNDKSYLINWKKSKIGNPIFDLFVLYKRHALDFDFESVLNSYEQSYPLTDDEKRLLYILISLPDKIEFEGANYELCNKISNMVDYLYKTDKLISPYYSKQNIHN